LHIPDKNFRAREGKLPNPMSKTDSRNLRGDALTARAAALGIALEDFKDSDGSVRELDVQRRIREVERYSADFRFDKLLVVCIVAFGLCGAATWLAMHLLRP
jgi:hypothetical protein